MRIVAETFKSVINKITYRTSFLLVLLLQSDYVDLTRKDLNTTIDKPNNTWNIHLVLYDT